MNNTNTGGPAFPFLSYNTGDNLWHQQEGMTLRDYFAAKALQGFISDPDWRVDMMPEETARAAYYQADAMLKAREA
jgi:hypothetical protein